MTTKPTEYCEHRLDGQCLIVETIAEIEVCPTDITCHCCQRHSSSVNDITTTIAKLCNPTLSTPEKGVGTRLANTLSWFVSKPPGCDCGDREVIMNMWGPDKCAENRSEILGWMRESALMSNHVYSELGMSILLNSVIALSRRFDY